MIYIIKGERTNELKSNLLVVCLHIPSHDMIVCANRYPKLVESHHL